jgi:2Fe-2S ferredoxin
MIRITFIDHQNHASEVEADAGTTLMQAAVDNGITGIVAECGGACSCATCTCFLDEAWAARLGPPTGMEHAMVEAALQERPTARLSCQITLTEAMDGLVVHVPQSQY